MIWELDSTKQTGRKAKSCIKFRYAQSRILKKGKYDVMKLLKDMVEVVIDML